MLCGCLPFLQQFPFNALYVWEVNVNLAVLLTFDIDLFAAMQLSDSLLQTIRANREPQVCDYEESELKGAHGCYSLMFDTLNLHC
jgi:hypothetical protein